MTRSAVLFDIDGTLLDSTYHHAIAWQRAFASADIAHPLWRIHRTVGMGGDKLVGEVAGDEVEQEHGDELRDRWKEQYLRIKDEVRPLPGAAELVRRLTGQGFVVALASSGEPEFAHEAVEILGVGDEVALVTSSEDVEDSKPEPDLLGVTLERLGDVDRAVFVGDTPYDVTAAAKVGLGCVALRSGGYHDAELGDAVRVVDVPDDLLDLDWNDYLREVHL